MGEDILLQTCCLPITLLLRLWLHIDTAKIPAKRAGPGIGRGDCEELGLLFEQLDTSHRRNRNLETELELELELELKYWPVKIQKQL
jgi:hypothetical protein